MNLNRIFLLQVALDRKNQSFEYFASPLDLLDYFSHNNQVQQQQQKSRETEFWSKPKYLYFSTTTEEADVRLTHLLPMQPFSTSWKH